MRARLELLCSLLCATANAARAPLCFVAHGKATLQCSQPVPHNGPIDVYSDGTSPQKAQKLFLNKQGKVCETKRCKRCMLSAGIFDACSKAAAMPVVVMAANGDWAKPKAIAFAAVLVAIPIFVFLFAGRKPVGHGAAPKAPAGEPGGAAVGAAEGVVRFLLRFATAWWFPLVAGSGTAINMFTIIFTGATVVMFLAAILGQPRRWVSTALCNAAGATVGTAILLFLVRERGVEYLNTTFPTVLASPAWAKATGLMTTYGVGGMLLVSSLPIILHPVIVFGILSGLSDTSILGIVFAGRTLKYLTMSYITVHAPTALRFFGIKTTLVYYATKATRTAP